MIKKNTSRILLVLTITTNIIYIIWRILFTVPELINFWTIFFSISLIIVEVVGMFEFFISFYGMVKSYDPPKPQIDYDLYPDVDIYIATYNEPIDLVQKTVNGCLHIQYPDKKKVRIFICDDGSNKYPDRAIEMKNIAQKYGIGYIRRDTNEHAKAGNLNNAMKYTKAPLILTMDADMIPMHHILMETVPYFLQNEQARKYGRKEEFPKIGFIQTPQSFYNTDLFQFNLHSENRIPNEQDYFYRNIQSSRNASNTVIYGGSNTLISRQALNDVGGFFTNSITEDFATGMKIQAQGYVCYALNRVCASGLSPDSLKALVKQRERWGRGCIQTARRVNLLFMKGLSVGQKISYYSSISYWYSSLKRFFYIMSPIVFAVFNIQVVDCTILEVLIFWLPSYMTTNLTLKRLSSNIRNRRWTNIYETVMFQAMLIPVILETFGMSLNSFSVTSKDKKKAGEDSDPEAKYRIMLSLPYFGYVILSFIGIFKMVYYTIANEEGSFLVVIFWLVSNLFNIIMSIFFLLGRKQYRSTERFTARVECFVRQGNSEYSLHTSDVSEEGFAFISDKPIYINPTINFDAYFRMVQPHETYTSYLRARVVQVIDIGGRWKYACEIIKKIDDPSIPKNPFQISEDEHNINQWNLILHDRIPSLPQTIEGSLGFYQDLEVNINRRLKKIPFYSRKTARISTLLPFVTRAGDQLIMRDFNYEYIGVEKSPNLTYIRDMEIIIANEFVIRTTREDIVTPQNTVLFKILNIDEIVQTPRHRDLLLDWIVSGNANLKSRVQENDMKVTTKATTGNELADFV